MLEVVMEKGTLYWVTGLSGAGKTTISTLLYRYILSKKRNIVFLDGDAIRAVYNNKDYSDEGRERVSYMNMRLFKLLTEQGIDVIAAVIGMKNEYRKWNREHIDNYKEIYLKVPIEVLIKRDSKKLYSRALNHEISNVYGIDLPYEEPIAPDIIAENDGKNSPEEVCTQIVEQLGI